jgi:hypothetical protein
MPCIAAKSRQGIAPLPTSTRPLPRIKILPPRPIHATDRPADRAPDRPADHAPDRAADHASDRAADRALDRATDHAPDNAADRAADRATDRATEDEEMEVDELEEDEVVVVSNRNFLFYFSDFLQAKRASSDSEHAQEGCWSSSFTQAEGIVAAATHSKKAPCPTLTAVPRERNGYRRWIRWRC